MLSLVTLPASAVVYCGNVSFSTLGQGATEDVLIYAVDGANQTLLGQWNTSSPYVQVPCGDWNLIVKPSAVSRFTNPTLMLTDAFAFVETYWIQIGVCLFLIGAVLWRR
jgi:hypothetical protein